MMSVSAPVGHVGPPAGLSIEQAFWQFHNANPHVYDELVRLARAWRKRRPNTRLGVGMLFEVLRWNVAMAMETEGDDFKLNNNYRSYYARLLMHRNPDLDGVFEIRKLHASDPFAGS